MNGPLQVPEALMAGAMASIKAEQALLGALLLDNRTFDRVSHLVSPVQFFDVQYRNIAAVIYSLLGGGKSVDVVTVYEAMHGEVELQELNDIAQFVPSAANAARYASLIADRAKDRQLSAAAMRIGELAGQSDRPIGERLDAAQAAIEGLADKADSDDWTMVSSSMSDLCVILQERFEGKTNAMPTGLADLDRQLNGGLRPGQLVIVGARPSMGKTALGLTIAAAMARDYVVGMLSMEMSHTELSDRLVAMLGRVPIGYVQQPKKAHDQGQFWGKVSAAVEESKLLNLHITDKSGLTIHQVRSKARQLRRVHGLHVLVVDYIGLMNGTDSRQPRTYQLEEVSRGLKELAKELGIAVLCLAQVNRDVEKRADQSPALSDLRDSGAIEQDADVVMFIHRPVQARPDIGPEWNPYAKLTVAKQRNGPTGVVHLEYVGNQTRFDAWHGPLPMGKSVPGRGFE